MANSFFNFSTFSSYLALSIVLGTGPLFAMDPEEEMLQAAIAASLRDTGEAPAPIENPQARTKKHLALFGNDDEAMLRAAMANSLQSEVKAEEAEDTLAARATSGGLAGLNLDSLVSTYDFLRTIGNAAPDQELIAYIAASSWSMMDAKGQTDLIDHVLKTSSLSKTSAVASSADELIEDPLGGIPLTSYSPSGMFGDAEPYHAFVTHYPTMAAKGNLQTVVFDLLSRLGDGPISVVLDVDNTLWARDDAFLDDRNVGTRLTNIEWPDVLIALKEAGHIVDLVTARSGREAQNVERDLATSGIRLDEHYRAVYATQDATKQNFVERCAEGRPTFFADDNLSNNHTVAKHFARLGIPVLSVNVGTLKNFENAEIKMTAEFLASEL